MAKIDVIMPQMGESIDEGPLSCWIKQVGYAVKRDEPIFEISTDKVDAEIPAPAAGVLAEILVKEGETVAVQTVVAKIETDASAAAGAAPSAPAPAASAPAPAPKAASAPPPPPAPAPAPAPAAPARPSAPIPAPAAARASTEANGAESAEERLRRRSTPLVRKMAAEHNLDLSAIPGSGLAGRVTKNDILNYMEAAPAAPAATAPSSVAPAMTVSPAAAAPSAPAHAPTVEAWPGDRVEPW